MALNEVIRTNLCANGSFTTGTNWWRGWKSALSVEDGRLKIATQNSKGSTKVAISDRVNLTGPATVDWRYVSVAADIDVSQLAVPYTRGALLRVRFFNTQGVKIADRDVPVSMLQDDRQAVRLTLVQEILSDASYFEVHIGWDDRINAVGNIFADNVIIQTGPTRESVSDFTFFDGDTPAQEVDRSGWGITYAWVGTPRASASIMTRGVLPGKVLTIEDISTQEGHPAVSLAVHGDGSGYSVTRTVRGFTTPIRGGSDIRIANLDYLEDHEIPLGAEVTYTLTHEVSEQSWSATIRLDSPSAWLSDPLDWTSAIELDMGDQHRDDLPLLTAGSLSGHKWGVGGKTILPLGARLPVQLGAARSAPTGLKVVITTWNQQQADRVAALVEQAGVLLLRVPHDPQRATLWGGYLPAEVGVEWVAEGITQWDLSGGVVAPPALPVLVVRATYNRAKELADGATYDAIKSRLGTRTYADVKRHPLQIGG